MRKRSRVVSKGFKIVFGFQINHSKLLCGLLFIDINSRPPTLVSYTVQTVRAW